MQNQPQLYCTLLGLKDRHPVKKGKTRQNPVRPGEKLVKPQLNPAGKVYRGVRGQRPPLVGRLQQQPADLADFAAHAAHADLPGDQAEGGRRGWQSRWWGISRWWRGQEEGLEIT